MSKGKVVALHGENGQVMCEDRVYNFNTMVVEGGIRNQQEVEFELENGKIKIIFGTGANKPTKVPAPKKENSSAKLKDTKVFLTEEK
jgi:hypothetical protein